MSTGCSMLFDKDIVAGAVKEKYGNLSRFARENGMSRDTIAHAMSRGRCNTGLMIRIAKALGRDPDEFIAKVSVSAKGITVPLAYRLEAKLSRRELAEKAGVSTGAIERLERGEGDCTVFTAACVSRALGLPMGRYLGYES